MAEGRRWEFGARVVADGARSRMVTAIAAALLGGFVGLFSVTLWSSFNQAAQKRVEAAADVVRLVETGATRTFESAETTLAIIAEDADALAGGGAPGEAAMAAAVLRRQMADSLRFAPHIRQISVVDGGGRILADTRGAVAEGALLDIAGLGLPATAVGGLSNGLRIGRAQAGRYLPLQGEAPAPAVRTVLPVAIGGGSGVQVVAALNPAHFRELMHDITMGANGGLALVQFDGSAIVEGGPALAGLDLRDAVRAGREAGMLPLPSGGAFERLAVFRLSARYPVAVAAVLDHRDSFAAWASGNRQMLFWTGAAVAGLALIGVILYREVIRRLRLQDEVRLLFEAVEQAVTAIMITDPQGNIVYVNPAFSRLTGYPAEEAVGRNPRFLKSGHTPMEEYARLWRRLRAGESWKGEFRNRTRDGRDVWEMASISPVRASDGSVTHFIAAKLDITSLKRVEAERERLIVALDRANRELTRFAEIAAHHLQEPVRRLLVFADMLGRPGQDAEKTAHAAARIRQNAGALRDQLRDIQAYLAAGEPRGEGGHPDPTDLARRTADAALQEAADPEARVEIETLPPVALDGARLVLALGHLVENGLKYRRPDVAPVVRISAAAAAADRPGRVLYQVEDNGRGIPPEFWGRAADVFERLDAEDGVAGTGIGLAIVRRIVESTGGSLRVQASGSLGGTAVLLDLPLAATAAPAPVPVPAPDATATAAEAAP